jgi:2-oxoglutarate ferredoxin oxidoreductase subunit beta
MATPKDFTGKKPEWCPGCGHFGLLSALKRAAANLGLEPYEICLVSGIGNAGKTSSFFHSYGFHVLHGRTLPVALGVKLANRDLTVLAVGGDGDGYAIGMGHFIHAVRRNCDITYIVGDNLVYGLTAGQTSPTSKPGFKTKSTPQGAVEHPIQPQALAMAAGITYLAQGFAGDVEHLTRLIEGGIRHRGFALIDSFDPCVIFNRIQTYEWYREHIINLDEDDSYDPTDREAAIEKVMDFEHLYTGLIYKNEERAPYEELLPGFPEEPLAHQELGMDRRELEAFLERYA